MNNKKLVIENNYKTELYNKVYDNFTELNSKYDTLSGKYSLNITEKQHLELRIKSLNNYNIDLVSKIKNIERKNEDLQTQSMINSNIYNNNIKDIEKDSHERILESNKSLEYRYKVQIHKLSDIIKLRTNELKFSDDKYAKIMSERFTEYTMRIQSLTDEIVRKDNEIKDLLVKHENDIKDTVVKTESLFRTKMKLDPPTNYIRILKGKDQRIYVLQATLKTFRKDFQRKLVTLRTEINKLNLELKEKKEKEKDEEKCEEKCEERVERKEEGMENVILPLVN
jgi:Ni,Fe-hydrogenase I large subunit